MSQGAASTLRVQGSSSSDNEAFREQSSWALLNSLCNESMQPFFISTVSFLARSKGSSIVAVISLSPSPSMKCTGICGPARRASRTETASLFQLKS
eukprot:CAMPEP_0170628266 /NCGR_PEP_ID=MMETSP0224-20130122/32563_1 /TAXON_ID=285029 /ORGANISM="Togula jolla, Strain CCCM 725" /LENGTH=95 /DNA_ID=CAMNT_0010955621 /DNA_START=42 /DNA_END=325 /DNA_ORIENTATION=+